MARFYYIALRNKRSEAEEFASSLSKDLKKFGMPSRMQVLPVEKVRNGVIYKYYEIYSEATPKQLHTVSEWMNSEVLTGVQKVHKIKGLDEDIRKHLKNPSRDVIKGEKTREAWRKEYLKKGGKIPKDIVRSRKL